MISVDQPIDTPVCGICGRPLDTAHTDGDHPGEQKAGKRVEYVVVAKRGGIAEFRAAAPDSKIRKADAEMLAFQLGVAEESLPGRRFSVWVEPAEYGIFESDYKLLDS